MKLAHTDHPVIAGLKPLVTPSWYKGAFLQTAKVMTGAKTPPKDSRDHGNNAPTVLLTQGVFCNPNAMETLGSVLAEKANISYAPDFPSLCTQDIQRSALLLRGKIQRILQQETNGDLILLGHSVGGLIMLETMRNSRYSFRKLICCATPFQGTPQARLAKWWPACKQTCPGSDYLKSLAEIDLSTIPIDAHVSEFDSVVPFECQVPPLSQTAQVNPSLHPLQHFDFIVGKKAKAFAESIRDSL